MIQTRRIDAWSAGWRGPLLAALLALVAGLPGLIALPPLDRDEARFAEASAQMLESGDLVSPHFQDVPRFKKPVGVYWMQALAVRATGSLEERAIWAYRLPSILGAMIAAAACAWGAAAFLRPGSALLAGGLLATTMLLSTEADIAATDGALCGAMTLAMAALGRTYLAARNGKPIKRRVKVAFWAAFAVAVLLKGPIAPLIVALTLISLCVWDRRIAWLKNLGWGWGLILVAIVVGPWAVAITVATDGAFWGAAMGSDLAPKLTGDQEGHGAPPGFYLALAPLLLFPASVLLPTGLAAGWRDRAEPAIRFALCWLIPTWLMFELIPTKLVHYPLPTYGALAWLMAAAFEQLIGPTARRAGAVVSALAAVVFAVAIPAAIHVLGYGGGTSSVWAALAAMLFLAAGLGGGYLFWRSRDLDALAVGGIAGVLAHAVVIGLLAPGLKPLWLSVGVARALTEAGLSPRQGLVSGPVTVAGYQEPSLVFLLGADTVLGDAQDAAVAIGDRRPVVIESRQDAAFKAALAADGQTARPVARVDGLDYSNNQRDTLIIYRPTGRSRTESPP